MSAPRRKTTNYDEEKKKYDAAQEEYKQTVQQYSGENAYQSIMQASKQQANLASDAKAKQYSAQQYANAMAAGESRANAIRLMNSGLSDAMQQAYDSNFDRNANVQSNAYANALSGGQNIVNNQANAVNMGASKDAAKYESESKRYASAMGAAGGAFTGLANNL